MEGVAKKKAGRQKAGRQKAGRQKASRLRDPLEPLMTANRTVLVLLALLFVAAVVALPFGHGEILGWGRDVICVSTVGMDGTDKAGLKAFLQVHPGIGVGTPELQMCSDAPSAAQRWWYSAETFPTTATAVVVVLVTYLVLRKAQRNGLYTPGTASRIRFLGWFLVADSVLRPTVEVYASHRLWATMADSSMPTEWNPVWAFLFAGLALLSVARIMGVGTAMREDLEGLV